MHPETVTIPWELERDPPPFEGNDIKSPEGLARYIFENYTKPKAKIFDPFAGLGTNMFIAEEMGRIPYGIEAEELKQQWVAGQLENWTHVVYDDANNMGRYEFPKMDLIFTSPPYMTRIDKWNPLYNGDPKYAGYDKYLKRMGVILNKLPTVMKKNTPLILQLDNLQTGKTFTPLIHDIASLMKKSFIQTGETVLQWKNAKPDYPHTHLLYFKKK